MTTTRAKRTTDFVMCDNDRCSLKFGCKRWRMGTDRRNGFSLMMRFEKELNRDTCKHFVINR